MADEDIIDQNEIEAILEGSEPAGEAAESREVKQAGDPGAPATSPPNPDAATTDSAADSTATGGDVKNVGDDVQLLLDQAEEALASANRSLPDAESVGAAQFQLRELSGSPLSEENATLDLLRDVELDLRIELGRTEMILEDVLKLRKGSVVPLDKLAGDPVDVFVNGRLIARGEVLVLNDNFCVRIAELIAGEEF